MKLKFLFVLFLFSTSLTTYAQDTDQEPTDNMLSTQFKEMKDKANNYQEYKVIKEANLNTFWKNVQDTLAERSQQIVEAKNKIVAQKQDITRLTGEVESRDVSLSEGEYEKAHLSVLGMDFEKESFVLFFWVVLAILLVIIAFLLYKHRYSRQFASKKHSEYETLDKEFVDYKNKSREKETRLMRDLQTERNTIEELSQRLSSRGK